MKGFQSQIKRIWLKILSFYIETLSFCFFFCLFWGLPSEPLLPATPPLPSQNYPSISIKSLCIFNWIDARILRIRLQTTFRLQFFLLMRIMVVLILFQWIFFCVLAYVFANRLYNCLDLGFLFWISSLMFSTSEFLWLFFWKLQALLFQMFSWMFLNVSDVFKNIFFK